MGGSRWLLGLFLLLLGHPAIIQATDMRYLRHSGGREGGGEGPANTTTTLPPGDLLLDDVVDPSLGLEEVLVVRGQEVVLECEVADHVKPIPGDDSVEGEVRWFHDGTQVLGDLRVSIMWTGRVVMSHAVSADSGVWWCHRSGRPGPRRRLLVTTPPERPYLMYAGAQLAVDARLTTREGNSITLHCVVEGGNPAPALTWLLDALDITPSSQVRSEWVAGEGVYYTVSNITLARVTKDHHNNTVACVVAHPALPEPLPVPLRLNIEYSPDFRLRRWPAWGSPVREGTTVSLLCHVDANPPSSPTWVKETEGGSTEVASSGEWLNVTRAGSGDRGWYKCSTSHTFGHFSSHSVFINVLAGGAAAAPLINSWYPPGEGPGSGSSPHTPQLLRKTTAADGLPSHCFAHNTTLLPHAGGVVVVEAVNTTVLSMGGRTTALAAVVCSRPPPSSVTWLPPGRQPPLDAGATTDRFRAHNLTAGEIPGCVYTVVTIVGVRPSDAGSWVVVAASERDADAALIRLNVTAAAHSFAASIAFAQHVDAVTNLHTLLLAAFIIFRSSTLQP
nr:hemicentin-2-like isoform X1 [Procambarus clarkii]